VVVRGLSRELADDLAKLPGAPALHVLNYYDTQRFGVPKAPKTTHLIGSALLSGDTDNALRLLRLSGTPEADAAKGHRRSSAEFFRELDPRVRAFLCCAHASFEWNSRLRERLVSIAAGGCVSMSVEGVPFVFAQSDADAVRLMASQPTLPYDAYRAHDGEVRCTQAQRATVLPVRFRLHGIADDDLFAGMRKCEVSLFLPSGAYATNALRQLMLAGSVRRMATRSEAVEVGP
jgi:tRNA pseudouridine13 synthase